jgi:hypothetical protein
MKDFDRRISKFYMETKLHKMEVSPLTGNTKGESITVPLTSFLTGLD